MTDEEIARHLAEAAAAGELRAAPSYGKPLAPDEGWEQTPEALRMPFKILRDANCPPPEIELFHRRAALREALATAEAAGAGAGGDATEIGRLRRALSELEQLIALRLEGLRRHATR